MEKGSARGKVKERKGWREKSIEGMVKGRKRIRDGKGERKKEKGRESER